MTPTRHPSPSLIAQYATGEAPSAVGLVVGAHLEGCPDCASRTRAIEAAEGALLAALPGAPLAPGALARALDQLALDAPAPSPRPPVLIDGVALPRAVAAAGLQRRRSVGRGFWAARVRTDGTSGWRLVLLRTPPGAKVPFHVHKGQELLAVLSGGVLDGDHHHRAGDFAEHSTGEGHALQAAPGEPCLCLIATQGPAQWKFPAGLAALWLGL